MPRTNGTYAPPSSTVSPAVSDTIISSADFNALIADIVDGLNSQPPAGDPRIVTAAGTITATADDQTIIVNKTVGAATTVDLPTVVGQNYAITVKDGKGDAGTNNITVVPFGAETIDGAASYVMASNGQSVTFLPLVSGGWSVADSPGTSPVPVARGGTGTGTASGTALDNITAFSSTGIMSRTGAGAYSFSGIDTLLDVLGSTQGQVLFRSASGWTTLATGTDGQVLTTHGAAANPTWTSLAGSGTVTSITAGAGLAGSANPITASGTLTIDTSYLRGFLGGLQLSNNGSDATNDIDIAVGVAVDSTNAVFIKLASALTKRLDAAWAVGTGNGGLDTGAVGNSLYYVHLIRRSDTGVVDALFSLSATSPTMPPNYDAFRRIGAFYRASATNRPFTQRGDLFLLTTPVQDAISTVGNSRTSLAVTVPPSMIGRFRISGYNTATAVTIIAQPTTETDAGGSFNASPGLSLYAENVSGGAAAQFDIPVNASSQIALRASAGGTTVQTVTLGWIDRRGRDD